MSRAKLQDGKIPGKACLSVEGEEKAAIGPIRNKSTNGDRPTKNPIMVSSPKDRREKVKEQKSTDVTEVIESEMVNRIVAARKEEVVRDIDSKAILCDERVAIPKHVNKRMNVPLHEKSGQRSDSKVEGKGGGVYCSGASKTGISALDNTGGTLGRGLRENISGSDDEGKSMHKDAGKCKRVNERGNNGLNENNDKTKKNVGSHSGGKEESVGGQKLPKTSVSVHGKSLKKSTKRERNGAVPINEGQTTRGEGSRKSDLSTSLSKDSGICSPVTENKREMGEFRLSAGVDYNIEEEELILDDCKKPFAPDDNLLLELVDERRREEKGESTASISSSSLTKGDNGDKTNKMHFPSFSSSYPPCIASIQSKIGTFYQSSSNCDLHISINKEGKSIGPDRKPDVPRLTSPSSHHNISSSTPSTSSSTAPSFTSTRTTTTTTKATANSLPNIRLTTTSSNPQPTPTPFPKQTHHKTTKSSPSPSPSPSPFSSTSSNLDTTNNNNTQPLPSTNTTTNHQHVQHEYIQSPTTVIQSHDYTSPSPSPSSSPTPTSDQQLPTTSSSSFSFPSSSPSPPPTQISDSPTKIHTQREDFSTANSQASKLHGVSLALDTVNTLTTASSTATDPNTTTSFVGRVDTSTSQARINDDAIARAGINQDDISFTAVDSNWSLGQPNLNKTECCDSENIQEEIVSEIEELERGARDYNKEQKECTCTLVIEKSSETELNSLPGEICVKISEEKREGDNFEISNEDRVSIKGDVSVYNNVVQCCDAGDDSDDGNKTVVCVHQVVVDIETNETPGPQGLVQHNVQQENSQAIESNGTPKNCVTNVPTNGEPRIDEEVTSDQVPEKPKRKHRITFKDINIQSVISLNPERQNLKGILKTSNSLQSPSGTPDKGANPGLSHTNGGGALDKFKFASSRTVSFKKTHTKNTFSYHNAAFEGEVITEPSRRPSLADVVSHIMRSNSVVDIELEEEDDNCHPYGRDSSMTELVYGKKSVRYPMDPGKMIVWLALAIMIVSLAGGIIFMSENYNLNHRERIIEFPPEPTTTPSR